MKFFKQKPNSLLLKVIILAAVFGFSAGVVGEIVTHVYLTPYLEPYNNVNTINTNQNVSIIPELRQVKKFVGTEVDFEIAKISQKVSASLAGIYQKKRASSILLNQIYSEKDFLGNGLILTSDGWLVSSQSVVSNLSEDRLVVAIDNKIFEVENLVADPLTEVVFLKIPTNNLPVVALGDWQETSLAQTVFALNSLGEVVVTNIQDLNYQSNTRAEDFIYSTEEFSKSILIKDGLSQLYQSSALVNLDGEIIGIMTNSITEQIQTAIPVNYFKSIIVDVLRTKEVKRPYLGLKYLDLSLATGLELSQQKGALVYESPKRGTPARQAEIEKDDIILKVDNIEVDKRNSLTELIQEYQVGDRVVLTLLREGQELSVEVFLGLVE